MMAATQAFLLLQTPEAGTRKIINEKSKPDLRLRMCVFSRLLVAHKRRANAAVGAQ